MSSTLRCAEVLQSIPAQISVLLSISTTAPFNKFFCIRMTQWAEATKVTFDEDLSYTMSLFIIITAKALLSSSTDLYLPGKIEGAKDRQDKVLMKRFFLKKKTFSF